MSQTGQTRKEVQLVLKVVTDPDGSGKRGMDQVAQAAERAERASSRAERSARGGMAAGVASGGVAPGRAAGSVGAGGATGGGWGAAGAAIASRFGLPTGVVGPAAAATAVYQVAATGKVAADAYADPWMTDGLRGRAIAKSVPFGETLLGFQDTLTGRAAGMAAASTYGRIDAAESQARMSLFGTRMDLRAQSAGPRAMADAFRGARAESMPSGIDRTSAAGEREYRVESQRLQLREKAADADRRASAASAERVKSEERLALLNRRGEAIDERRFEIAEEIKRLERPQPTGMRRGEGIWDFAWRDLKRQSRGEDDANGPARMRLLAEDQRLLGLRTGVDQQNTTERQRLAEIERRRIQALADRDRARGPEMMRLEAAQLEERAGRAMSAAERIGGSTPEAIDEGYMSLLNVVQGGVENADPSELAAAQRFAPETVQKLVRQAGRRNPMFDAFRAVAPSDFPAEGADDLFRRAGNLNQQARQGELDIQGRVAAAGAAVVAAMEKAIVDGITAAIPRIREQVIREIQIGRQQGSGAN